MIRFLSLLGFAVAAFGASDSDTSRILRAIYVQAPADAPSKVYLVFDKESREIDLPQMSISIRSVALTDGPLRVYAAVKPPTKEEPLPDDAPFADIPAGMQSPLLVLLPTGSPGPLAFRMLPVDFSQVVAPPGSVFWFNLTERTVYAKLGTAQAIVAPHRSGIVVPSGKFGQDYPVFVDLSLDPGQTETLPFLRTSWVKEPFRRDLLFVVNAPNRKHPQVLGIVDMDVAGRAQSKEPTQDKDAKSKDPKRKDPKKR